MPVMVVPISPASKASSLFMFSTGDMASHLARSTLMLAMLAAEATQKAAAAAFCSTAWASMAEVKKKIVQAG